MDPETPSMRTLRRALLTVGGDEELARRLGVSRERLAKWVAGEEPPTVEAYATALDIFANGPLWAIDRGQSNGDESTDQLTAKWSDGPQ